MNRETALQAELNLGCGYSIQPPESWNSEGFITHDNDLWLQPKSQMRWRPADSNHVSLHWSLSPTALPQSAMQVLLALLSSPPGWLERERVLPLCPALIRMPAESITRATIVNYPEDLIMLGVEYVLRAQKSFGMVFYAPTAKASQGEFQILAYEGSEPDYTRYWKVARSSLETFRHDQPGMNKVALATMQRDTDTHSLATPPEVSSDLPDQPTRGRTVVSNVTKSRRRTAELSKLTTVVHILKPGETIKRLVNERWPELDEEAKEIKRREISALNRIHANPIETWNLQPGMRILLPAE